MFSTMILRLIQESVTELHYTLQKARLRALELVEDLTGKQMIGVTLPHRQLLSTERSGTCDV